MAQASWFTKALWLILAGALAESLWVGRYQTAFIAVATFSLTLVPMALARRFEIYVPPSFMAALTFFIVATLFFGEVWQFYDRFWWWDVLLHGGSAVGFGLIGFVLVFILFQGDRYAAPTWAMALFAFCFAMTIGALWEVFEFAMDEGFGTNMQKSGLPDTMTDIIVDAVGGFIGAGSGALYLKGRASGGLPGMVADFLERNRKRFGRK
ncbi:hypothetical protein FHY55_07460 [Oceanicola sp. D3]|uniref:hypothetical protein n=1 Tax=Oceanicola sp. D3 TaxID=2587163 RepID=UPI001124C461|nr:hypothetical protein [Oceanicola sp. D3]QDC09088.1 hypothetical protein FHY55_07460 [Oceanicola sp. D3]